jgi:DNA modification methylase
MTDTSCSAAQSLSLGSFQIHRGDALQRLLELKQARIIVDTIVTSPPYLQKRQYGRSSQELGRELTVSDYIQNLVKIFLAIPLAPWGSVWVNVGDKRGKHGELLDIPERFCVAMSDAGFYRIDNVVWAKEKSSLRVQRLAPVLKPRGLND